MKIIDEEDVGSKDKKKLNVCKKEKKEKKVIDTGEN